MMDMDNKYIINIFRAIISAAIVLAAVSCSKWNEKRPLELNVSQPWQYSPELWKEYKGIIANYKKSEHYIFYALFENSPERALNEQSYMRCLPDSLDIVSLKNADNFSLYDAEDMEWMKAIGTKVLYRVDFAGRQGEFATKEALNAYLDKVIASVQNNSLDGFSFTAPLQFGNAAGNEMVSALTDRLAKAKSTNGLLVFEGNPLTIPQRQREEIDYFVLPTETTGTLYEIGLEINSALDRCGIDHKKILLSASTEGIVTDNKKKEHPAVEALAKQVVSCGDLAGLAVCDIEKDYYHSGGNYSNVRRAIRSLNPSK